MNAPGIIILAAGLGTRFRQAGGVGNKLLAPLADGALLLEQTLAHAQASGLPPVVVTRPEYAEILTLAQRRGVRAVCLPSGGSGESIAAGVRAAQARAGWLIVPGDMAWITAEDHRRKITGGWRRRSPRARSRSGYAGRGSRGIRWGSAPPGASA
ncbi:TPA: nucleotidyltransferase family protein [Pluralibacter gergoviae]